MRENDGNLGQLKSIGYEIAATRLMLKAARLQALIGKANFNPNQPRVPRGSPRGGEWTRVGTGGDASAAPRIIWVSHEHDPMPEVPQERPATTKERNRIVKRFARWLARRGSREIPITATWIQEFADRIALFLERPKTLEELQRNVPLQLILGTDAHHIVEEDAARKDGFPESMIQAPENKVRISRLRHEDITAWFMTKNDAFGGISPREYLRGKTWAERRRVGLDALVEHGVLKPWPRTMSR